MLTTVPAESADASSKAPDSRGDKASTVSTIKVSDPVSRRSKKFKTFLRDHDMSAATGYRAIARGELKVHKRHGQTIVLDVDEAAWLASLPEGVKQPERLSRRRPNAA